MSKQEKILRTRTDKELLEGTLKEDVAQWLIVSKATLKEAETSKVSILKATGDKCPRCWNYTEEADENEAEADEAAAALLRLASKISLHF